MTWHWEIEGFGTDEQTIRIWDHEGDEVHSEPRESWGFSGERPDIVDEKMEEIAKEREPNSDYALLLVQSVAFDDIERGAPPDT